MDSLAEFFLSSSFHPSIDFHQLVHHHMTPSPFHYHHAATLRTDKRCTGDAPYQSVVRPLSIAGGKR